jgi:hypothetical protein
MHVASDVEAPSYGESLLSKAGLSSEIQSLKSHRQLTNVAYYLHEFGTIRMMTKVIVYDRSLDMNKLHEMILNLKLHVYNEDLCNQQGYTIKILHSSNYIEKLWKRILQIETEHPLLLLYDYPNDKESIFVIALTGYINNGYIGLLFILVLIISIIFLVIEINESIVILFIILLVLSILKIIIEWILFQCFYYYILLLNVLEDIDNNFIISKYRSQVVTKVNIIEKLVENF